MTVPYRADGEAFVADTPRLWSEVPVPPRPRQRAWDLHPDGNRLVMAPPDAPVTEKQNTLVFVFNFFDELQRIAPARK
jgi:hypothetical protein